LVFIYNRLTVQQMRMNANCMILKEKD